MLNYNTGGAGSDIDYGSTRGPNATATPVPTSVQTQTFFWLKKALIQARKEQYFMPLASVTNMPKHYGKSIKVYEYVPLLDDRNVNDQGINAAGVVISPGSGNLYGSSKDIGTINGKLPNLTENGGRVNRVGFTRLMREGSIRKFGFFTEFTQEALDFDSDDELMEHISRELMNGAVQLTEAVLQMELLASAGVILYSGAATSDATITGEGTTKSIVTYQNLMRLDQMLTDNRTPKQTKVITGSRLIDTKTIPSARVMYIGSELVPLIKGMKDLFDNPAFIPVQQYGDAATILNGEIGTVDAFRIVVVPEMLKWAGMGFNTSGTPLYRNTTTTIAGRDGGAATNRYDVYPMLVVGDDSFTTIGFQTDGKTVKFSVLTKMPGRETADRYSDPYGETGFSSIKWYYGLLVKRPERIALIKTVAPI